MTTRKIKVGGIGLAQSFALVLSSWNVRGCSTSEVKSAMMKRRMEVLTLRESTSLVMRLDECQELEEEG